jgi:hypothetical protein
MPSSLPPPDATENHALPHAFAFPQVDEPEEGVPLDCELMSETDGGFADRCTGATGKWVRFTTRSPE